MSEKEDLFNPNQFTDKARKVNLQSMKLESTKEYMETHYFKSN